MEVVARRRGRKSGERGSVLGERTTSAVVLNKLSPSCRSNTPTIQRRLWSGRRTHHRWKWEGLGRRSRNGGDSQASYLPLSALLSQALVNFAMRYEEKSPVALSLTIAVIRRIPRDGRRCTELATRLGIPPLRRHGFVRVTGAAGGQVIPLTLKGAAVSDVHEERLRSVVSGLVQLITHLRTG